MRKIILLLLPVILVALPCKAAGFTYVNYGTEKLFAAESLQDEGLLRLAEQEIIDLLENYSGTVSHDRALVADAMIDALSGNFKIADAKLEDFIAKRPNSPFISHAAIARGYIAFEKADYRSAEYYFFDTRRYSQQDYEARKDNDYAVIHHNATFWQAVSMSHQGRHQEALPVYTECATTFPEEQYADDAIYMIARTYEMNRENATAIKHYTGIGEKYPFRNTLLISKIRLANNHLLLREYSAALLSLEKAETILGKINGPDSIASRYEEQDYATTAREMIIYLKGEAYNMSGNYDLALLSFQTFLETFSVSELTENARLGAGWALLSLGRYREALEYYDQVIENISKDAFRERSIAQLYRTVALKELGENKKAQDELSALSVQPTYPFLGQVLLELGQIYYENKDYDVARRTLERGIRESNNPKTTTRLHLLLGSIYLERDFWELAATEYKHAYNIANNTSEILLPNKKWYKSEALLKRGVALVKGQRSSDAIQPLLEFIGSNPNDARTHEAYFWLAEAYYRTDLLNNAADTYDIVVEKFPNSPRREEALYGKGWSNFRMQRFSQSSKVFDRMIDEFPKSRFALEVLTRQGDGYYLQKSFAQAAESYRRAAAIGPRTDEGQYAQYQLSHALYRMGSLDKAVSSLLDFIRLYNDSPYAPNAMYLIGWIKFQQGKYNEAIDNFKFLISAYPQSGLIPRAHYAIGDAYYNAGDFESAILAYRTVVEEYPSNDLAPEALKSIQYALMGLGREDEAIEIAGQYIETNPESPFVEDFQLKRAEMFYSGKKFKSSVDEYKTFLDKHPDSEKSPDVIYWLGKSYANMRELKNAEDAFNRLVREYPNHDLASVALLESGIMYKDAANLDKADSLFSRLRLLYPKQEASAQAGFERAVIKIARQDTLGALQFFAAVADSFPNLDYGDQSRYQIARYYRNKDIIDSALYHFQILAEIPANQELAALAQYRVGELYMKKEQYSDATIAFRKVIEKFTGIEDWFTLAHLSLGEAYEKLEDFESAREVYNALIAVRPDTKDDYHKTAQTRLDRLNKSGQ